MFRVQSFVCLQGMLSHTFECSENLMASSPPWPRIERASDSMWDSRLVARHWLATMLSKHVQSCLILLGLEAHNMYAIYIWVPFCTSTHLSCCSVHVSSTEIEPHLEVMLGLSSPCYQGGSLRRMARNVSFWLGIGRLVLICWWNPVLGWVDFAIDFRWFPVCVLPMVFEQRINNAICSAFSRDSNDSPFFPPQLMSSNKFDAAKPSRHSESFPSAKQG